MIGSWPIWTAPSRPASSPSALSPYSLRLSLPNHIDRHRNRLRRQAFILVAGLKAQSGRVPQVLLLRPGRPLIHAVMVLTRIIHEDRVSELLDGMRLAKMATAA